MSDEIPAVMHFVAITHIRRLCVVDDKLLYTKTRDGNGFEMFDLGERELVPLAADDSRRGMSATYGAEADWFAAWSAWRHLKRASERGIDLAQRESPALPALPAAAAAATAPSALVPGS